MFTLNFVRFLHVLNILLLVAFVVLSEAPGYSAVLSSLVILIIAGVMIYAWKDARPRHISMLGCMWIAPLFMSLLGFMDAIPGSVGLSVLYASTFTVHAILFALFLDIGKMETQYE